MKPGRSYSMCHGVPLFPPAGRTTKGVGYVYPTWDGEVDCIQADEAPPDVHGVLGNLAG